MIVSLRLFFSIYPLTPNLISLFQLYMRIFLNEQNSVLPTVLLLRAS